jgi:hypothetical protein
MGFFSKKERVRIALISIRATEVVCAYTFRKESGVMEVCYWISVPIEHREGEEEDLSLLRTLEIATAQLVTEGAPLLKTISGSGTADTVVIQIAAPWQHTEVSRSMAEFGKLVTVTNSLITHTVADGRSREHEDDLMEETVLSTMLNGYTVKEPIGKKASTLRCSALRSYTPLPLQKSIRAICHAQFHSTPVTFVAAESTLQSTIASIAPFHTEYAIISMDEQNTTVLVSQNALLVTSVNIPQGTCSLLESVKDAQKIKGVVGFAETSASVQTLWAQSLYEKLAIGIKPFVMPNTVFLVAQNDSRDFITRMLLQPPLLGFWISGATPSIVPVLSTTFSKRISFNKTNPDLEITLLALRHLSY